MTYTPKELGVEYGESRDSVMAKIRRGDIECDSAYYNSDGDIESNQYVYHLQVGNEDVKLGAIMLTLKFDDKNLFCGFTFFLPALSAKQAESVRDIIADQYQRNYSVIDKKTKIVTRFVNFRWRDNAHSKPVDGYVGYFKSEDMYYILIGGKWQYEMETDYDS